MEAKSSKFRGHPPPSTSHDHVVPLKAPPLQSSLASATSRKNRGGPAAAVRHTVKFKEQSDQDILVVTVEPPSPLSPSPEPRFHLPPVPPPPTGTPHPQVSAKKSKTSAKKATDNESTTRRKAVPVGHKPRLSEGCTSLMYACQQGLTEEIVKELREKVRALGRER